MIEQFISFLKENDALDDYKIELKRHSYVINPFEEDMPPKNYLIGAFNIFHSYQGADYYRILDRKWQSIVAQQNLH